MRAHNATSTLDYGKKKTNPQTNELNVHLILQS